MFCLLFVNYNKQLQLVKFKTKKCMKSVTFLPQHVLSPFNCNSDNSDFVKHVPCLCTYCEHWEVHVPRYRKSKICKMHAQP